ncbi:MAG: aminotransferase class I/II-fold pyridoxal phosphate-dependent enzyme [Jiangellales bacterium]
MPYVARDVPSRSFLAGTTNPAYARRDAWESLGRVAERLSGAHRSGVDVSELEDTLADLIAFLRGVEGMWLYPGLSGLETLEGWAARGDYDVLSDQARVAAWQLGRWGDKASMFGGIGATVRQPEPDERLPGYFTLLVVSDTDPSVLEAGLAELRSYSRPHDDLVFDIVAVNSFESALAAVLVNHDIQAVLLRYDFPFRSDAAFGFYGAQLDELDEEYGLGGPQSPPRSFALARVIRQIRPHLNLYMLTDESMPEQHDATYEVFDRVFYRYEARSELNVTVMSGVRKRVDTPFFDALKEYAQRPIGNFHALPIARGNSLFNSKWIHDMAEFYGRNIFLAETSSTAGGLDSLLSPHGSLKEAQDKAARAWGAEHTYFATNGTSTSNKIVVQALTRPDDIVLIDRNCHKSHHYGLILGGAHPIYLDAYPLEDYAIYGGVPLRTIKQRLLDLRRAGRLDAVRMVLLTNCTFDGVTYNPGRVMQEVLAIKPDVVFLWDEAWFAFVNVHPLMRHRAAMASARALEARLRSPDYRQEYEAFQERMADLDPDDDATWLDNDLLPDPTKARVRVYATQSTHKSLSALRQGSMIHVYDQDFERMAVTQFHEAYNTHTSTSPNYQILASLDLARRQFDLEGYGLVARTYEIALTIRRRIANDPLISSFMQVLRARDLVPEEFRPIHHHDDAAVLAEKAEGWPNARAAVEGNEFVLDPTRITLFVGGTGWNGDEFKNDVLMDEYGIQVNKTSINSVLLIITIGATWGAVDYLLDVLRQIARRLELEVAEFSPAQRKVFERRVHRNTAELPHLPDFSAFHPVFSPHPGSPEGDMRAAYFLGYDQDNVEYLSIEEARDRLEGGRQVVSSALVVPYPPGFPILVPGQLVSPDILEFMDKLDVREIHGYEPDLGLAVFTEGALASR